MNLKLLSRNQDACWRRPQFPRAAWKTQAKGNYSLSGGDLATLKPSAAKVGEEARRGKEMRHRAVQFLAYFSVQAAILERCEDFTVYSQFTTLVMFIMLR